jgi:protein arginine N-methyltransferase 1
MTVASACGILEEHRAYVSDRHRLAAYEKALKRAVRPGDVVVDLGAGTGVLGLLALRAGARTVYAIERGPQVELAAAIARDNGASEQVVHIHADAATVALPERADVVVCDQLSGFGYEAGIIELYQDAKERLCQEDVRLVPGRLQLCMAPVQSEQLYGAVTVWEEPAMGFDLAAARPFAVCGGHPCRLQPEMLLAAGAVAAEVRLGEPASAPIEGRVRWQVSEAGWLHGLGGWFRAELCADVHLSNGPTDAHRLRRDNLFLPLHHPVAVSPQDTVAVSLQIVPQEPHVAWSVEVTPPPSDEQRRPVRMTHSTLQGTFFPPGFVRLCSPDARPGLGVRGQAQHFVLEQLASGKSIGETQQAVREAFPSYFLASGSAARFVRKLVLEAGAA